MTTVTAHVPWLFTYLRLIPGATKGRKRAYALAAEYVNQRISEGSNAKDLLYHLVSVVFFCWLPYSVDIGVDR
jgi:hypothetical protein